MSSAPSTEAGIAIEAPGVSERTLVFLIASIQFISILEFMIVPPLGPDFAKSLGIPSSNLGLIAGSYTAAAAVAGLVSSFFIEKFDRRSALAFTMLGLVIATASAGLAGGLPTLLLARVMAGCFGGPAMALAMAVIADVIPAHRRGRAMGAVMSSFAAASVLGVPVGLELARIGGWRLPFFSIAALGVFVAVDVLAGEPLVEKAHPSRVAARRLLP
jgi:predicted MFS family arabinose efflux permease